MDIGESIRLPNNPEDRYAIAVIRDNQDIFHGKYLDFVRFSLKKLLQRARRVNPWGLGVHL